VRKLPGVGICMYCNGFANMVVHGACRPAQSTCSEAAAFGHLHVLQLARENGCPWDAWTCDQSAGNGHLNILKWLHENGCPWRANTCTEASQNGHLHILQWLRENGCPWDKKPYLKPLRMDIWMLLNGHMKTVVRRMGKSVPTLLPVVI
jgi:hypothetical protein